MWYALAFNLVQTQVAVKLSYGNKFENSCIFGAICLFVYMYVCVYLSYVLP